MEVRVTVLSYIPRRVRRKEDQRLEAKQSQAARDLKNSTEAERLAGIARLEASLAEHVEALGKLPDCLIRMQTDSADLSRSDRRRNGRTSPQPGHRLLGLKHLCFALGEDRVLYVGQLGHQPATGRVFIATHKFAEFGRQFPGSSRVSAGALKRLLAEG